MRRQMEEWFLRYSDPDLDARKEGVTGTGQYCRAGSRAHLLEKYGPLPRPRKERIVKRETLPHYRITIMRQRSFLLSSLGPDIFLTFDTAAGNTGNNLL